MFRIRSGISVVLLMVGGLPLVGCSSTPSEPSAAGMDKEKARMLVETALESWKKGQPPEALQKLTPPLKVVDSDWSKGNKLTNYEIANYGKPAGDKFTVPVRITTTGPGGGAKSVIYSVTVAPDQTVTREGP